MLENDFVRMLQSTPAWTLVGIPVVIWAAVLLGHCLSYRAPVPEWIHHVGTRLLLFAALLVLSVFAWQFVTQETGWWIMVLIGTPLEAVTGLWYYRACAAAKTQNQPILSAATWYVPFVLALSWLAAHIWAEVGASGSDRGLHPIVFLVVWAGFLIITIWVGKATYWYVDGNVIPLLERWARMKEAREREAVQQKEEMRQAVLRSENRDRAEAEVTERIAAEDNLNLHPEDRKEVGERVAKISAALPDEVFENRTAGGERLYQIYRERYPHWTSKHLNRLIEAAARIRAAAMGIPDDQMLREVKPQMDSIAERLLPSAEVKHFNDQEFVERLVEEHCQLFKDEQERIAAWARSEKEVA